ncbi:putative mRNA export protein mlo3 [Hyaloscypha finlandica]|nr:putative mRNA export protein mlo3 [Hyaloscypha finlandica]
MSARLDKSLDEIISTQRRSSGRGRGRRVHRTAPVATAPAGGVKKNPKHAKGAVKNIPTGPSGSSGEGKILVTGFPKDITEPMIKEYFVKMIGPVKRVELSYGPGGASRGIANILFARSESATRAVAECNGIPVDGKPIKVELIIDATRAKAIPPPKGLSERITQPKPQPKSAAVTKTAGATRGRGKGGRGKGAARNARPAKKTAEELDSEMVDYWQAGAAATETNGAAQPAAGGDANMDDEILVCLALPLA